MFNSSLHPSGLQTRQLNRQPNPLQRHLLNKTALQEFYQNISNNISYESKLHQLADTNFNIHYKKTRYWDACKFISNEEGNEEPELTKIKVSNRYFYQIMTDGKEIEFDLRSAASVVVQPRSHFDFVSDTRRVCSEIEKEYQEDNNESYLSELREIHKNNEGSFGVFVRWHFQGAQCRIVVLVRDKIDKDKMLFIYNGEGDQNQPQKESRLALTYFQNDEDLSTTYMKELIKVHMCKQKNEGILAKFKSVFSESIKSDFKRKIDDVLQVERMNENRFTDNVKLIHAFRNYDRFQSEDMLNRWKNKSSQKAKDKHLMVEISEIWVKHVVSMKNLKVKVKNSSRAEEHQKRYVFNRTEGDYSVYEMEEGTGSKCCLFELPKGSLSKEISVSIEANDNKRQKTFYNNYTYFKSEGVDAFSHLLSLLDSDKTLLQSERTCFIMLKTKETRNTDLHSVEMHHQRALFDQVGEIPTKYRSSLSVEYNPTTYPIVRKLLAPSLPEKINKSSYQQCYYSLVKFIQSEQNKSQLNVAGLPLNKVIDRCPMNERLGFYEKEILKAIGDVNVNRALKGSPVIYESRKGTTPEQNKLVAFLTMVDGMMVTDLCGREFKVSQVQYKNLQEDIVQYKPLNEALVNQLLVKYLHFISRIPKIREFGYSLSYSSFLIPIIEKYILIFFNSRQASESDMNSQTSQVVHFFVFVCFVARVYPYSDPNNLRNELFILRHLVLSKLPYYNDFLSRNNIGLENLIGPHLLGLFTDLSEELTFRIWDYLISSDNVFRARIAVAFTLLVYLQTTRNLPIIPINQFMEKVAQNYKRLHIEMEVATQMEKGTELYFQSQKSKDKKLEKLVQGKEKTIVSDKYLQRIILGDTFANPERAKKVEAHYQNNPTVQSIQQINYPLPRPNYFGQPITEIVIFVHNLNILENLNLMAEKYALTIVTSDAKVNGVLQIPIVSKNNYYNESFKIPLGEGEKEEKTIRFQIMRKGVERVQLQGELNYGHYHKDKAYKVIVMLRSKNNHNKGETVLNVSFCLKSTRYNQKLEERETIPLETLSGEVFDYDISDNNEVMLNLRELHQKFQQIKNPLDQFSTEQNKRLKNSALNYFDYAWLQNSKTTVEDIKTIFYHLFPQEKDHDLKLEFSKIYEIFSEEHHMQHIYLAEVLTKLVLALNVTRKKKLSYLYCLGVHYQNAYTKKISSETINSMIRLLLRQKGLVSACPYEIQTCGKIIEASYFSSSLKSQEERIDFTEILQDWAYMCTLKFSFNSIILGTANDLSILRSLFDDSALGRMESQTECRFEIVYQIEGKKYLWSAIVDPKTFHIIKRGTKFLNTFDGYSEIKYLDSTQEFLYNCQNIIPLQAHKTYNYSEFTQVMFENELVRYALEIPSTFFKEPPTFENVRPKDPNNDSRASSVYSNPHQKDKLDQRVIDHPDEQSYQSWALYRSQNCLQNWRRCCIVGAGPVLSEVKYAEDPETYSVSTLDIISMDQIDLQVQPSKGSVF